MRYQQESGPNLILRGQRISTERLRRLHRKVEKIIHHLNRQWPEFKVVPTVVTLVGPDADGSLHTPKADHAQNHFLWIADDGQIPESVLVFRLARQILADRLNTHLPQSLRQGLLQLWLPDPALGDSLDLYAWVRRLGNHPLPEETKDSGALFFADAAKNWLTLTPHWPDSVFGQEAFRAIDLDAWWNVAQKRRETLHHTPLWLFFGFWRAVFLLTCCFVLLGHPIRITWLLSRQRNPSFEPNLPQDHQQVLSGEVQALLAQLPGTDASFQGNGEETLSGVEAGIDEDLERFFQKAESPVQEELAWIDAEDDLDLLEPPERDALPKPREETAEEEIDERLDDVFGLGKIQGKPREGTTDGRRS
jgi:hypothetical protein